MLKQLWIFYDPLTGYYIPKSKGPSCASYIIIFTPQTITGNFLSIRCCLMLGMCFKKLSQGAG